MYTLDLNLGITQEVWNQFYFLIKQGSRNELAAIKPVGFNYPLYLRRSTSDIDNFLQIFFNDEYGFVKNSPQTVLDLGGYIGLASSYLAHKYPEAKILLVEPDTDNYTLARLNCRQFPNVECLNVGAWSKSCDLTVADRSGGDVAIMFREIMDGEEVGTRVKAMSVSDLMSYANFNHVDLVKIDIEGSELQLFSDHRCKEWIRKSNLISCELHDRMVEGCSKAYNLAFAGEEYTHGKHGEYDYYAKTDKTS